MRYLCLLSVLWLSDAFLSHSVDVRGAHSAGCTARILQRSRYLGHFSATTSTALRLSSSPDRSSEEEEPLVTDKKKKKRAGGVYARPSAAIERGSGFFIPGLEGPKVRWVAGTLLLLLSALNYQYDEMLTTQQQQPASYSSAAGNEFAETIAILYSGLLLLQAAIETIKEQRGAIVIGSDPPTKGSKQNTAASPSSSSAMLSQQWFIPLHSSGGGYNENWRENVEWAAASYLSLTPATHIILLEQQQTDRNQEGRVLYWLGRTSMPRIQEYQDDDHNASTGQACQAAFATLRKSKSGRVAVPSTHDAVVHLAAPESNRCVILQRIDDNDDTSEDASIVDQNLQKGASRTVTRLCWMVTSNQLLAAFTPRDLQWLGQLGQYVSKSNHVSAKKQETQQL